MYIFFLILSVIPTSLTQNWKDILISDQTRNNVTGVSAQCANDTETWLNSLKTVSEVSIECLILKKCSQRELDILKKNLFALEQLDAFGKLPSSGLFEIPLIFDGSYQECERISGQKYETNYCYLILIPGKNATCPTDGSSPSGMFFRSAVCMPDSCDTTDLSVLFNQLPLLPFTACGSACSRFPVPKDSAFWGYSAFLSIMTCIAILSTSVDYIREAVGFDKTRKSLMMDVFFAFSLWTNAESILSVKEQKPGFIKSLDCIRCLSILWVVTGHTFTFLLPPDQLKPIADFKDHFWNHLLLNAFLSVDTFFLLSGIVVAYLFFKQRPKAHQIRSPVTWILFYVHRFLRLTPPYMIFLGFFTVYGSYVQGPFSASQFNPLLPGVEVCKSNWWRNLLYTNNMGPSSTACYGPTWYLAVDTQLYLIAPIILVGFYVSLLYGTLLITVGCMASVITVYILYSVYDLPADFFGNGNVGLLYDMIYHKPWIRCPPYLFGLFVGYFLATFGKREIRFHWVLVVFGWIAAFGIGAACLFSTFNYDKGAYWSVFERATFYNFSRLGWAVAVSWVIVANHMGWGGPIDAFMSHPMWQPFGRLSYCAYIVHFFTLVWYLNISDSSMHFYSTFQIFIYYAVPACLLSYFFAFFWSCLFEVPTLKLEKMLIMSLLKSKPTRIEEEVSVLESSSSSETLIHL